MANKIRKLPHKEKKENENRDDKLSVNRLEEEEKDGPVSVNRALEEERAERNLSSGKTSSVADNQLMRSMEESSSENKNYEETTGNKNSGRGYDEETDKAFKLNEIEEKKSLDEKTSQFQLDRQEIEEDKKQTISKGKKLPLAKELRDTDKDANPIEEEDLGLPEDSYLIKRKVSKKDLMLQNESQEKQFLGANVRKIRDFISIFDKGQSSKNNPKIDLSYEIAQNPSMRKELIAQQLLRNYKSKNEREQQNTLEIFKELNLLEEEEFKDNIDKDEAIHKDEKLISTLASKLPRS